MDMPRRSLRLKVGGLLGGSRLGMVGNDGGDRGIEGICLGFFVFYQFKI